MHELEAERARTGVTAAALKAAKATAAVEFLELQAARERITHLQIELAATQSWRAVQPQPTNTASGSGAQEWAEGNGGDEIPSAI